VLHNANRGVLSGRISSSSSNLSVSQITNIVTLSKVRKAIATLENVLFRQASRNNIK
jgi:hypothetical protein